MPEEKLYQEEEIDLFSFIKVIYKYRKIIIGIILMSVFIKAVFVMRQSFRYQATATFFPLDIKQYKSADEELPELKSKLVLEDLIISILESRKMADKISNDLNLKSIWNQKFLKNTRETLRKVTDISLVKGGVISINVITENGDLSAKIANAYIDNLEDFNKELQLSTDISLVQVIDRAVTPEERMPRGLINKTILTGILSVFFAILFSFILNYIQESKFKDKFAALIQIEKIEQLRGVEKSRDDSESNSNIFPEEEFKKKLIRR